VYSCSMEDVRIEKAKQEDWPYIKEKLKNYILDPTDASWEKFFVAKIKDKTVGFGRIIDHGEYFELASVGVDYYHRKKGIGKKILFFIRDEAKRQDSKKPIYGVTPWPDFLKIAGFVEVEKGPEELEYKINNSECVLHPERTKILKLKEA